MLKLKILFVAFTLIIINFSLSFAISIQWNGKYISSFERLLGVDDFNNLLPTADVIEVDVVDTPKWYIDYLKNHDKLVVGYINAGAIETYREDFELFPSDVIGKIYPGWEDERFLDIRQYNKFKDRMMRRLDLAKQKGFDAVEFDNIDIFENSQEIGFDISKEDMVSYLSWLLEQAHARDLRVLQKNAPGLISRLGNQFDGALIENSYQQGWAGKFKYYVEHNKPVFAVEYVPEVDVSFFKSTICPAFNQFGFVGLLKNLDLDQWSVSCLNLRAKKYVKLTNKINNILAKYIKNQLKRKSPLLVVLNFKKYKLLLSKYVGNDTFKKRVIDYLVYKLQTYIYYISRSKLLPPKEGIYLGIFKFFGNSKKQLDFFKLINLEKFMNFKSVWVNFLLVFDQGGINFPTQAVSKTTEFGKVPFLILIPTLNLNQTGYSYSLVNIIKGKYDKELIKLAQDIKSYGNPILIDFAPEANGDWFPWGGRPALFKEAYKHIYDIFSDQGATNVTWFYHFNLSSFKQNWNNPLAYYPGDEYVDWVGFSMYGLLPQENIQKLMSYFIKIYYQNLKKFSKTKPLAILEFGLDINSPLTQQRYQDFFDTLEDYQKDLNIHAISFGREIGQDDNIALRTQALPWLIEWLQNQAIVSELLFTNPMKD